MIIYREFCRGPTRDAAPAHRFTRPHRAIRLVIAERSHGRGRVTKESRVTAGHVAIARLEYLDLRRLCDARQEDAKDSAKDLRKGPAETAQQFGLSGQASLI